MYYIVSADHFNGVLGQARNAWWMVGFCQFLWVVRWLNIWLLNSMVGIMVGKENWMRSRHTLTLNSKHRKVTKATIGNLNMKGQMGKDSFNRLRLDVQVAIVVAMTSSHNSYLLLRWRCGKLTRDQEPLWLSLQCDFRGEVDDKERLTGKAEEGSNLSQ